MLIVLATRAGQSKHRIGWLKGFARDAVVERLDEDIQAGCAEGHRCRTDLEDLPLI